MTSRLSVSDILSIILFFVGSLIFVGWVLINQFANQKKSYRSRFGGVVAYSKEGARKNYYHMELESDSHIYYVTFWSEEANKKLNLYDSIFKYENSETVFVKIPGTDESVELEGASMTLDRT